jgi:hypothetical protein
MGPREIAPIAAAVGPCIDWRVNTVDCVVNTMRSSGNLAAIRLVVRVYVLVAVGTIGLLAVLAAAAPRQAPREAWVRAIIVAVFAVLLPMRLRAAQRGSVAALGAVGLISSALFLVTSSRLPARGSCRCGCGSRWSGSPC